MIPIGLELNSSETTDGRSGGRTYLIAYSLFQFKFAVNWSLISLLVNLNWVLPLFHLIFLITLIILTYLYFIIKFVSISILFN